MTNPIKKALNKVMHPHQSSAKDSQDSAAASTSATKSDQQNDAIADELSKVDLNKNSDTSAPTATSATETKPEEPTPTAEIIHKAVDEHKIDVAPATDESASRDATTGVAHQNPSPTAALISGAVHDRIIDVEPAVKAPGPGEQLAAVDPLPEIRSPTANIVKEAVVNQELDITPPVIQDAVPDQPSATANLIKQAVEKHEIDVKPEATPGRPEVAREGSINELSPTAQLIHDAVKKDHTIPVVPSDIPSSLPPSERIVASKPDHPNPTASIIQSAVASNEMSPLADSEPVPMTTTVASAASAAAGTVTDTLGGVAAAVSSAVGSAVDTVSKALVGDRSEESEMGK